MKTNHCLECKKVLDSTNPRAKYCSERCKSKAWRANQKKLDAGAKQPLTPDEVDGLKWLFKHVPAAGEKLAQLLAVHGKEAFSLAYGVVVEFSRFHEAQGAGAKVS